MFRALCCRGNNPEPAVLFLLNVLKEIHSLVMQSPAKANCKNWFTTSFSPWREAGCRKARIGVCNQGREVKLVVYAARVFVRACVCACVRVCVHVFSIF